MTTIGPNNNPNPKVNNTNPDGKGAQGQAGSNTGEETAVTHVDSKGNSQDLTNALDALASLNKAGLPGAGSPPFTTDMSAFMAKFPPSVADQVQTVLNDDFSHLSDGAKAVVAEAVLNKLAGLA